MKRLQSRAAATALLLLALAPALQGCSEEALAGGRHLRRRGGMFLPGVTVPFSTTNSTHVDGSATGIVQTAENNSLHCTNQMTIGGWIRLTTTAINQDFMSYGATTNLGFNFQNGTSNGQQVIWVICNNLACASPGFITSTSSLISANTWFFVAAVYDGTQGTNANRLSLWFNGSSAAGTVSGTVPTTLTYGALTNPFAIGQLTGTAGGSHRAATGDFDEMFMFCSVLDSATLTAIYNGGTPTSLTGLGLTPLIWLRMGESPDTTSAYVSYGSINQNWAGGGAGTTITSNHP